MVIDGRHPLPFYPPHGVIQDVGGLDAPYFATRKSNFVDSAYYEPLSNLDIGEYVVSRTDNLQELLRSFQRYDKAKDALHDFIEENINEAITMTADIFAPFIETQVYTPNQTVALLDPDKGAGFGCLGLKSAFLEHHMFEHLEMLSDHHDMMSYIPVWTANPKLEVRLREKDCRTTLSPPTWFQQAGQMLFKHQNLSLMDHPLVDGNPSALGMRPIEDWPVLVARLDKHRPIAFGDGDGSTFDAGMHREVKLGVGEVRIRLGEDVYTDDEIELARWWYYHATYRFSLLPDGHLALSQDGNGSGDPNTTVDNIIGYIIELYLCWKFLGNNPHEFPMFLRRDAVTVFGDDLVFSVTPNPTSVTFWTLLPAVWKHLFGLGYECNIAEEITGVSFLSRRSISTDGDARYISKPSDPQRQHANLLLKIKPSHGFLETLSRWVAYRMQWVMHQYQDNTYEPLDRLEEAIERLLFSRPGIRSSDDPSVVALLDLATCTRRQLQLFVTAEVDIPSSIGYVSPGSFKSVPGDSIYKTVGIMLTYKQWKDKHQVKLEGLSEAEKRKRYDDYRQSVTANAHQNSSAGKAVMKRVPKPVHMRTVGYEDKKWLSAILDPFSPMAEGARMPSTNTVKTNTFSVKVPINVRTNGDGNACFLMNADIRRAFCDSWTALDVGVTYYGMTYTSGAWGVTDAWNKVNQHNGNAATSWQPIPKFEEIQRTYSGFRVVGCGLELKPNLDLDATKGFIAAGVWHGTDPFPNEHDNTGMTFQDFQEVQSATSMPVAQGVQAHALPTGVDTTKFRKPQYFNQKDYTNTTSPFTFSENNPKWFPLLTAKQLQDLVFPTGFWGAPASGASPAINLNTLYTDSRINTSLDMAPYPQMSPPFVVVNGCSATNQEVLRGYAIWHFEAIVDENTYVPGFSGIPHGYESRADPLAVGYAASLVPTAMPTKGGDTQNLLSKTANAIMGTIKDPTVQASVGSQVKTIATTGLEDVDWGSILSTAGTIASTVLAFL